MNSSGKVLILGASGGIGGEVARRLVADNWQVRALKRGAQIRGPADGMQWIAGDALNAGQVAAAAAGCDVIVHAVNPPGYRHWRQQVLPMLHNTLQAAEQQRALAVLPGTVYNYGPDAFPLIAEAAPQQPVTRKGAIRVEMEQASGISGLICPTSPTPSPRCWPAGMSLSRLLAFICRATGTRTAAK